MQPQQVAPAEPPDMTGPLARAWRISHPDEAADHPASMKAWLVCQPASHPHWSFYSVGAISLADVPGVPPANKHFPEATHEFLVVALDPSKPLPPIKRWEKAAHLTPIDLCHQVVLDSDEHAQEIVDLLVRSACDRWLLDEDHRAFWKRTLDTTARHYREGVHGRKDG
jgi:hypothetical protein